MSKQGPKEAQKSTLMEKFATAHRRGMSEIFLQRKVIFCSGLRDVLRHDEGAYEP